MLVVHSTHHETRKKHRLSALEPLIYRETTHASCRVAALGIREWGNEVTEELGTYTLAPRSLKCIVVLVCAVYITGKYTLAGDLRGHLPRGAPVLSTPSVHPRQVQAHPFFGTKSSIILPTPLPLATVM